MNEKEEMEQDEIMFLDTSIQIDRNTEADSRKNIIYQRLRNKQAMTSTLVLREFKERIIHKCIALLEIVMVCDNRADLETMISQQFTDASILLKIMGQVDRETRSHEIFDKELIIETIKGYIEGGMEKRFMRNLVCISDETKCELAPEKIRCDNACYRLRVSCNRQKVKCNLPKFISTKQDALNRFCALTNREQQTEIEKICCVYEAIQDNYDLAKGQRNCNTLSDVIIALEAPVNSIIYTTDRHYEVICLLLGKSIFREDFA